MSSGGPYNGGNFGSWLPQPSESDIANVRRGLDELRRGGSRQFGLLGPSADELATMRQQRGIPNAEAPSPMVSVGRGAMDAWEPVKQTYLNMFDTTQAQAYRQQRAEDERLYQRGLLSANPQPGFDPTRDDLWRSQTHAALALPFLLSGLGTMSMPAGLLSYGVTQKIGRAHV